MQNRVHLFIADLNEISIWSNNVADQLNGRTIGQKLDIDF